MRAADVSQALKVLGSPTKAEASAWFFKTGKGQYGEGDQFIGVTVPEQRKVAKHFRDLPLTDIETLLKSPIHEHRLTALLILVDQYQRASKNSTKSPGSNLRIQPTEIVEFYLAHKTHVNNWDLVDSSAPYILGDWLLRLSTQTSEVPVHQTSDVRQRKILYDLAASQSLWDRRIAIIATYAFIKAGEFDPILKLAERLLSDKENLIHKAVGWMLREVGNRDSATLLKFLDVHAATMPRTMLRYAIEKLSPPLRLKYLGVRKTTSRS